MIYDFLVAGFPKCGTTTCHNLLRQNPQIYLPDCKETFYFSKSYSHRNKSEDLEKNFYGNRRPGQKVGGVEPSFARYAKRVRPCIDANTKVIFLIRNPIEYIFSYFEMCMSFGVRDWYDAYCSCGSFSGIVREYIKPENGQVNLRRKNSVITSAIKNGRYINSILEYKKITGDENLKIILFEDFILDEIGTIDAICRMIGVKSRPLKMKVGTNKSQKIMPNSKVGRLLLEKRELLHHNYMENRKHINKMEMKLCDFYYRWIPAIASKHIEEQIDPSARRLLYRYYDQSVKELQKLIDVNLEDKWNWRL